MMYERMIKRFMNLDNDMGLPLTLRLYMLLSPGCRREVRGLMEELEKLRGQSSFILPRDLSDEIMGYVFDLDIRHDFGVSSLKWLFVGVFIWFSIVLFSFSDSLIPMGNYFGPNLMIPIYIVLGLGISIYAAAYMASHIEEIKKSINASFRFFHR